MAPQASVGGLRAVLRSSEERQQCGQWPHGRDGQRHTMCEAWKAAAAGSRRAGDAEQVREGSGAAAGGGFRWVDPGKMQSHEYNNTMHVDKPVYN